MHLRIASYAVCLLLVGSFAQAECAADRCSSVYIEQIYVESAANSWIRTSGVETDLSVCTADSNVFLWLDGQLAQKKEVLSVLMMAFALGRPIYVRVYSGARGCGIAYVTVDR